ncbi:MAG: peptidase M15 [Alloprevotella sp.]|nr:peptidase M15 [Alloprevotella sp.]
MKWFKEKEFVCRCCGELPPLARANVRALVANVLDPVREKLGKPIVVNSGYRCRKHNQAVGGVPNSQHIAGEAADIAPAGFKSQDSSFKSELEQLQRLIEQSGRYDQLIIYPTFLHVSWRRSGNNRRQKLWAR